MHNRLMQHQKFSRWHEKQLYLSFAWLLSCLMCGFLFAAIVEFVFLLFVEFGVVGCAKACSGHSNSVLQCLWTWVAQSPAAHGFSVHTGSALL